MKQNGYLLAQIAARYQYGEDLTSLFNLSDYYNKINPAMVRDAARQYLKTEQFREGHAVPGESRRAGAGCRRRAGEPSADDRVR